MLKSVAVVIGSYILSVVLVLASDPLLSKIFPGDFEKGRVPSDTALVASTACFVIVSIFCAWVCARFAPGSAWRHVLWFFIIGEVMGVAAIIPNWSKGWPHWYWLSWLLTWPISCWIGLKLARRGAEAQAAKMLELSGAWVLIYSKDVLNSYFPASILDECSIPFSAS
jgi:hypothetical protein